jgi:hypothetical protein
MFRFLVASLVIAAINCLLTRAARAETKVLPMPILPSIVAPVPRSMLNAARGANGAATAAALMPVDHRFLAHVARLLDRLRRPVSGRPRDTVWRNPSLRDPARERDATSFGIRSARMSTSGAAFAGFGLGAHAAQLVDLAKIARKLPVNFAPTMCQGGGGIMLRGRW